jgi:Na+-translocating ferredoxin:NAD+ oxidoreductase subunit B
MISVLDLHPGAQGAPYSRPKRNIVPISVDHIDACLPQTQCTQCGFPSCRAYAEALARGAADINRCPPGDTTTLQALAQLLGVEVKPLDTDYGRHRPRTRAVIDEAVCIGCRKCIDACPVDAIVGARKAMHSVIQLACSGCELCLAPCPVDCIDLVPAGINTGDRWPEYTREETEDWRRRYTRRRMRLAQPSSSPARQRAGGNKASSTVASRKAEIKAAVQRVQAKRGRAGSKPKRHP